MLVRLPSTLSLLAALSLASSALAAPTPTGLGSRCAPDDGGQRRPDSGASHLARRARVALIDPPDAAPFPEQSSVGEDAADEDSADDDATSIAVSTAPGPVSSQPAVDAAKVGLVAAAFSDAISQGATDPASAPACPLANATVELGETTLAVLAGAVLDQVLVGSGVVNFTCSQPDERWTPMGAVAAMLDASCAIGISDGAATLIPLVVKGAANSSAEGSVPLGAVDSLADQFWVPDGSSPAGIAPVFQAGGAQFVGSILDQVPAPDDPDANLAWHELADQGDGALATTVFRTHTVGGQPSSPTCSTGGEVLRVPFAALYWFLSS